MAQIERDVIVDHAFQSEENFRIAYQISQTFQEIRGRMIVRFLDELKKQLITDSLADWITSIRDEHLGMGKERWSERYPIWLGADNHGAYVSVWFENPDLIKDGVNHVRVFLNEHHGQGKPYGENMPWYRYVSQPYMDWQTEKGLLSLYRKDPDYVLYFQRELSKLCKTAERVLDDMLKPK